jgi:isopropylmalate/homocitrate/citramalate synthase
MATESSQHPWRTANWSVSPHNFDPSIRVASHEVELHDITIRDGEECADLAYTVDDKVRIAEALATIGIKRTELFLTVPGWLEAVRAILRRKLPLDLYVNWHPGRVERALDLGVRHVMVWYWIGEHHQKHLFRRSRAELLDEAAKQIEVAREAGCAVNVFMPECSRATLDQISQAVAMAKDAGATAVTMVDSFGVMRPPAVGFLVSKMREWGDGLDVDVHCHNDFGLSTANVLAAYDAGAVGLNVCVNGVGYRAGNAPLDEVAMALEALYGVETGLRLELLPWLSSLVETITGIRNGYFKPIVGAGAFSTEEWGGTQKLEDVGERPFGFAFEPEVVGRKPRVVVGKWSDVGAVEKKLTDYGLTATTEQLQKILVECQRAGIARHRPLEDDEVLALATAGGACHRDA